ncbi:HK97 family phage prohead protease [Ketogulonicigenium vulgare]|uniref:HK97 family phage prohead protease n=1 Tax=Ketogulonicigenium vulgare TaxID=92945 RepID=UPI002359969B|nr:HK97 family phage prohead protease [Ketogulonicigenium vulgare]
MEYKPTEFKFEIKADEQDANTFSGYASIFGNLDRVGDIVLRGAFTKSLEERRPKMLWQHDPNQVIGVFDEVREDEKGLFVMGRFAQTPKAQEVRELMLMGAIDSMSIGYVTKDYEYSHTNDRLLKEVILFEVSLVTFGANESAKVEQVKSAIDDMPEDIQVLIMARNLLLS